MATFIDHQKAFISLFNQTARYHKRHKVFEDFVSCSVIALENRLQFSEAREQKYLRSTSFAVSVVVVVVVGPPVLIRWGRGQGTALR